jgi:hypothetical protein
LKRIDELRKAEAPVLVERGREDSVLIIAFTGFVHRLSLRVYEFFEATKDAGYSRILLRDKHRVWYHHGIDRKRPDFPSLFDYLNREIERLKPKTTICLGTSAGGYAAIVAGHHIRADYVHAFAPDTLLDISLSSCIKGIWSARYRWPRWKLLMSRSARPEFFDLANLLKVYNGKTVYYIHYCSDTRRDAKGAARLAGLPGVVSMPYSCSTHQVAMFLARTGFLPKILNARNQNQLAELAKAHFCKNCSPV